MPHIHPATNQRINWYVAFGQLGYLSAKMSFRDADSLFWSGHEVELTLPKRSTR